MSVRLGGLAVVAGGGQGQQRRPVGLVEGGLVGLPELDLGRRPDDASAT